VVFIDETWTKTNMTRLRGWAPKGERLVDKVPHGRWKTATFLAALRNDRIDAPCLFDGPVEELFAQVKARRLRAPSRDACASVASALLVMRHKAAVAPQRKDATRGARNGARKSGRALLRHLQPLRQKLAAEIAELSTTASKFGARERERLEAAARAAQAADDRLEAAARAVETLLPALDAPPIAPLPDGGDPIRFIALEAQRAWADANDGAAPQSKNTGDPLVKFVSWALSLVGMSRSPETVSAVLRGRRRTKRADRIRN
jgi:hypothetical protein